MTPQPSDPRGLGEWLAHEGDRAPATDPTLAGRALALGRARVARRRRRTTCAAVGGVVAVVVASVMTASGIRNSSAHHIGAPSTPRTTSSPPSAEASPSTESDLPIRTVDGEPLVTCGGTPFRPSVMADGITGVLSESRAREIFREVAAQPEQEDTEFLFPGGVERVDWRLLAADGPAYYIGVGRWTDRGPSQSARAFEFRQTPDGWLVGGGYCYDLSPVLEPGHSWLTVSTLVGTAPDDRSVTVAGYERGCTGGRDPGPFLQPVRTVETTSSVIVYATTDPIEGGAGCPLGQGTQFEVELSAPLGDRVLLDGSSYPNRRIRQR